MMLVVRRPFKNYGVALVPGSVVEPATIKHLKARLRDRSIIEVSETSLDAWNKYFMDKFGVPINVPKAAVPAAKPAAAKAKPSKVTVKAT